MESKWNSLVRLVRKASASWHMIELARYLVELYTDRGNHSEFLVLQKELTVPGELKHTVSFDFEFKNVEKQYECYMGVNAKLRYMPPPLVARR